MYRCELCDRIVPPNTRAFQVVLETRPRRYPPRPKVNQFRKDGKKQKSDDPGGQGVEIVREVKACAACAASRGAASGR